MFVRSHPALLVTVLSSKTVAMQEVPALRPLVHAHMELGSIALHELAFTRLAGGSQRLAHISLRVAGFIDSVPLRWVVSLANRPTDQYGRRKDAWNDRT